ncbi:antirestriction protein ArdA [Mycobacterium intracellulare]|uniref:Antirestriction protein ArdA n=1 Tax=Mycobacterium intracellulare TaxID=1767 RepID=A0AAE4R879_MYCIT|nr:antirestriction protein ArdA [Mycobacterium intracellulare]MDV6975317.1 antirestriction protein ArdA [Mycobacterium intracellulare]MDV6980381.1 antirestriction protein ArdA [Mycobacterium intracellulare]MDV7010810.1 antirestriction protein ArdA [Mycobacterium intracellulare]MDV7025716.1 antirestriction protein ArdA [Mycobacterium intracellulare]
MDIDNTQDIIDVRDIIERVEALEETSNGSVVDGSAGDEYEGHEDDHEEYAELKALLDELRDNGGDERWRGDWYPVTLIRDSYFKEYAQDFAEEIGAVPSEYTWPTSYIDWDAAVRDLKMDYTSVEYDGVTYWYR